MRPVLQRSGSENGKIGAGSMPWLHFVLTILVANLTASGFYLTLRLPRALRTVSWFGCSAVVLLAPLMIDPAARGLRFVGCVACLCLLFKIYDAHRAPVAAAALGPGRWVIYLPNWFWFVLQHVPHRGPAVRDWMRVAMMGPCMVVMIAVGWMLLRIDWSPPFLLEHSMKVMAFAAAMFFIGQTFSALFRQLAGPALDPFGKPFVACTPADFLATMESPEFHDFFSRYVFRPAGGVRRPSSRDVVRFCGIGSGA